MTAPDHSPTENAAVPREGAEALLAPHAEPSSGASPYPEWTADPAVFHEMYVGTVDVVLAYFRRRIFDPEIVFDLTADVYAVAWRRRRRYRFTGKPVEAWLIGIASRVRLGHIQSENSRKRTRQRLRLEVPDLDDAGLERVEQLVDSAELRNRLDDALRQCSVEERQLLSLRFDAQLPYAAIGERLGVSEGAARVRVHRSVTRLNLALTDQRTGS